MPSLKALGGQDINWCKGTVSIVGSSNKHKRFAPFFMNADHIALIHDLQQVCDLMDLPIWLESGWAVDARLGRITREHEDVDFAVPAGRMDDFKNLLVARGASDFQQMDYGFLVQAGKGVLLDCEPCHWSGKTYELEGVPAGSCPAEKQGVLAGVPVRCTSWAAILWEYFYYLDEMPYASWPVKDKASYQLVQHTVGEKEVARLHALFRKRQQQNVG
jgi:2''-aminoglycoside nucleotidyltransferase